MTNKLDLTNLPPVEAYAELKLDFEQQLRNLQVSEFALKGVSIVMDIAFALGAKYGASQCCATTSSNAD